MPKARCEDCEEAGEEDPHQLITPTGRKLGEGFSAEFWRIVEHKNKKTGPFCPGSGRLV
jgi:hypothetical protein